MLTTGAVTGYPQNISVGDYLLPLLYIYYFGNPSNEKRALPVAHYQKYLSLLYNNDLGTDVQSKNTPELIHANRKKFFLMFSDATQKNQQWSWMFSNAVNEIAKNYNHRLPVDPKRCYYGTSRSSVSSFPVINPSDVKNLDNCMECLRLLFENDILPYNFVLGVRPLDLYTSSFADQDTEFTQRNREARILGRPVKGQFILNNRPNVNNMYKTFTGIDIDAVASMGNVVTDLENITSLSWSVHSARMGARLLGRGNPVGGRAFGSRTVAGTMVFALSDHHPLLRLLPSDFPSVKFGQSDRAIWRPNLMPDQIPPFDLTLILMNEYGYATIMSLYGVQLVDEGGVLSVDNLITEAVVQYVAVGMDPLVQVEVGENGEIDPYGLFQGGFAEIWKHREAMVAGVAYTNLERAFNAYYDIATMEEKGNTRDKEVPKP